MLLEVSALNGFGISEILDKLSKNIIKLIQSNMIDLKNKNCGIILPEKKKENNE